MISDNNKSILKKIVGFVIICNIIPALCGGAYYAFDPKGTFEVGYIWGWKAVVVIASIVFTVIALLWCFEQEPFDK